MPTPPRAFLLALGLRSLHLLLPHTYFQPDEFYQAFEPAFSRVFGSGYLTWEWRDLPGSTSGTSLWQTAVVGGRLRGWIWPGVFVLVYELAGWLGLQDTEWIVFLPRIVGVLIAATTDYYTYLLAGKVLGPGSASGALFLSLTSLFNAHLLPRALSTSPETLLTTMALYYYPLPSTDVPTCVNAGELGVNGTIAGNGDQTIDCAKKADFSYVSLERVSDIGATQAPSDNIVVAAALAALSICIRPTMGVFWAYLQLETTIATWRQSGLQGVAGLTAKTLIGGASIVAASTAIDYTMNGRLTLPFVTFFYQNVVVNIASFYGATGLGYHLTQSLPILLFPIWYWWGQGYLAALFPPSWLPTSLASLSLLDRPPPLRMLARAIAATIGVLSLSPHSEWRFLHPLLPQLLLFALPALNRSYQPSPFGMWYFWAGLRQYCRINMRTFYFILLAPLLPFVYLNVFHGAAQVNVMSMLRRGAFGEVTDLVALMPCHSTPWASHLGDTPGWFLTCEPPLSNVEKPSYRTEEAMFYGSPVQYLLSDFPARPKGPLRAKNGDFPSHIILFGDVLEQTDSDSAGHQITTRQALTKHGYAPVHYAWNGLDLAQDDERRRGGVYVWRRLE